MHCYTQLYNNLYFLYYKQIIKFNLVKWNDKFFVMRIHLYVFNSNINARNQKKYIYKNKGLFVMINYEKYIRKLRIATQMMSLQFSNLIIVI